MRGALKWARCSRQKAMISSAGRRGFGLQGHKGAGRFAPHRIGAGDHRRLEHAGVPVEDVLDLDRRNVLAARDDDVLRAVLKLDIAVGVHDPEIARMKPAAGKGLLGRARVLQIALHDDVAAHEDLAHRRTVCRHRCEARRICDHQIVEHRIGDALARLEPRPLGGRQLIPFAVPGTDHSGAVDLGQPVDMGDAKAETLHPLDHRGGGCGAGCHHLDRPLERALQPRARH